MAIIYLTPSGQNRYLVSVETTDELAVDLLRVPARAGVVLGRTKRLSSNLPQLDQLVIA